ncbi:MAG: dehydrogenase, partial [Chitinivibrionales bacterium]|nr:dehydrogenase [Chitinivibrionales bacterium]MBD3397314.1 dehydrogenase [Chitinivibrionales bacterium]
NRYMGHLVRELTIGIIGIGRIGKIVTRLLQPFEPAILACDLEPDNAFGKEYNLQWCDKEEILSRSDVVTLHIPNNKHNYHYMDHVAIGRMKTDSFLINTSRGPIVDEAALVDALRQRHLGGAALDVFEKEPYEGALTALDNVVLTAHMGASARECRFLMELGAAEDCARFLKGEALANPAPEEEYEA